MRAETGIENRNRVWQIVWSHLNGKNVLLTINTCAIPVIKYSAKIITLLKEEMKQMEVNRRKLLTLHGVSNLSPVPVGCTSLVKKEEGISKVFKVPSRRMRRPSKDNSTLKDLAST